MSPQPDPRRTDIAGLAARLRTGETRALAKALTVADIGGEEARALLQALDRDRRETPVVGMTGPPGSGKSTLISAMIRTLRERDMRVAALAVDPSSPKSGGAILGDRARMGEHGLRSPCLHPLDRGARPSRRARPQHPGVDRRG